jgi:hypothetical protein
VTRIGVILGSTRPGRRGEPVARWLMDGAGRRSDAKFELVDLADYRLRHLDEPLPRAWGSTRTRTRNLTELRPGAHQARCSSAQVLDTLFGEVIAWSQALAPLRQVTQAA